MGMTMTEKIFARHAGLEKVVPGQLIKCKLDLVLGNDITAPPAIKEFERIGRPVFDKDKIALVPDHFIPNKDIRSAEMAKTLREFARKHAITHYFEVGRMGIEHVLLPEVGLVAPGELIIGADSHTCTYGALGAFATGVGSTDMGAAMATGDTWFKVPSSIKVELTGQLPRWVGGKDVILTLIGMIGVDGARYQSLEFAGEGVAALSMTDRLTIANMAIEAGAKNGIFPVDDITESYVGPRVKRPYTAVKADADAEYERTVTIDLCNLTPVVALPHLPENVKPVTELAPTTIDQVVIGSCTNGRIEDLAQAAQIIAGHEIHPSVRTIVIPGSQAVYLEAMAKGYIEIFIKA
jgi:3-isopropylmalate/(R)-2-methylmalate dehydratase large subunit